jgi:hypothetical protein
MDAQVVAGDDLAGVFQQVDEQSRGLLLEMDDHTVPAQLAGSCHHFEGSEAPNGRGLICIRHGDNSDRAGV